MFHETTTCQRQPLVPRVVILYSFDQEWSSYTAYTVSNLVRLKRYLGHEERFVLVNSFIYSNFNYCPLVWMFSSKRSLNKIENLQKRALRFVLDDYTSSYELLLEKSGKPTMNLARERLLLKYIRFWIVWIHVLCNNYLNLGKLTKISVTNIN